MVVYLGVVDGGLIGVVSILIGDFLCSLGVRSEFTGRRVIGICLMCGG